MLDRLVIVVANLAPRNMMGKFDSHGMVLAGWNNDDSNVELLDPPAGSEPGDAVSIEGFERKPVD